MRPLRIAILHQGCIPNYRRAFYERLAKIPGREYVVFHGDPEPGSGVIAAKPPFPFANVCVRNRFWRVLGRSVVYQPVLTRITSGGFDALIIGHEFKYIASFALLLLFRLQGKPVLFWGFGPTNDLLYERRSYLGRAVTRWVGTIKRKVIALASGFLVYTVTGVDYVIRAGMPRERIVVINNTIDVTAERVAYERAQSLDRAELRRRIGISADAIVFLFIGRLTSPKRVDWLIDAVKALLARAQQKIEVLIVGGGPEEARLQRSAAGAAWCRFLGPVDAPGLLAEIFRVSDAVVIPGYVGLAVNHAFAHGIPLITCRSELHSPEIDYVRDGYNGLILEENAGLCSGLQLFASSVELRDRLGKGALETGARLDLAFMVKNFDAAVARALADVATRA